MRKRRTREHVIADLSINHVERFVLRCGWTVERKRHDYGVDLILESYGDNGQIENGWVAIQVKATESLKRTSRGAEIAFRLHWRDLIYWLNELQPVILIVYSAAEDQAFWLHVQPYFRSQTWGERSGPSQTVTVRIPAVHILDEDAVCQFAHIRDEWHSDD